MICLECYLYLIERLGSKAKLGNFPLVYENCRQKGKKLTGGNEIKRSGKKACDEQFKHFIYAFIWRLLSMPSQLYSQIRM